MPLRSLSPPFMLLLAILVLVVLVVASYYRIIGMGLAVQTITTSPIHSTSLQVVDSGTMKPYMHPGLAVLKLCPFDVKVSVIGSTHKYERINPQSFIVHAARGDKVNLTLGLTLNPNLLDCVRDALNLAPGERLSIEYGLRLGSGEGVTIAGARKMNLTSIKLQGRGGGPYNLTVTIDDSMEPGSYYTVLYAWIKITGKAEIKSETEYIILINIK